MIGCRIMRIIKGDKRKLKNDIINCFVKRLFFCIKRYKEEPKEEKRKMKKK